MRGSLTDGLSDHVNNYTAVRVEGGRKEIYVQSTYDRIYVEYFWKLEPRQW